METTAAPVRAVTDESRAWFCLDVVNVVDTREDPGGTYGELLERVREAGGLSPEVVAALAAAAAADPDGAAEEVRRMAALLRAEFAVFHGLATAGHADEAQLAAVQAVHAEALAHGRLEHTGDGFRWTWDPDLRLPRWLVARSAIELVTGGPLRRVKVCASEDGCTYLFVDTSKNNSRRWCSMADCGNTAKARRLTEKRRASRTTGA